MIYRFIIDPLLSGLRKSIKEQIKPGTSCLDIACGTGDMVFRLMDHCTQVTGVDMNESAIQAAQRKVDIKGLDHLSFKLQDATKLSIFNDQEFDYSIISLAIHQFDPELRAGIILEAKRVSKTVIIADYAHPMPKSLAGRLANFIEFLAGKQHHRNFRHYQANSGIQAQLSEVGLGFDEVKRNSNSVFTIVAIS